MPAAPRTALAAALAAVAVTSLAVPANAAPAPEPQAASGPLDEAQAQAAARSSGKRVEVSALGTETETVYANPDGTFTLEARTEPTRVRRGDAWVAIDPTLVRRTDGTVAPVATTMDVTLSGGGTTSFARLAKDGNSLALSWPKALPQPTLDGARATYAEVFPGVDLVVTVSAGGFSETLVVKNRAAALNPALRRVAFGAKAAGLTLRADESGGFTALDDAGLPAMVSPEPTMWDSKGGNGPGHASTAREGDRVAKMRTEVSPSSVAIVPDAAMLADPATTFPLYLDPTILNASHSAWGMVDEYYPSNEYYKFASDEGVGYQNFSGVSKKRQFHAFTTSAIAGSDVVSATFKAWETHAASCTATEVELWRTGGYSSTTNWSNQPSWYSYLDNAVVAYGRTGCATYPDGAWVEFTATAGAQTAADTSAGTLTLGLKAGNEADALGWKRFRNDAQLSITYNRTPTMSNLRIVTPSKTCTTGTGRAWISDPTPTLGVTLNDADDDNTRAQFDYGQIGLTTSRITTGFTAYKASPSEHTYTTSTLSGNPTTAYSWRAKANDGTVTSAFSGLCEFYLDTVVPAAPTVSSDNFPAGAASPTHFVGNAGNFTLNPGAGTGDTDQYKYSFDSDALNLTSNPATLNDPGVVSYTPTQAGVHFLMVRAYDRASNVSTTITKYVFRVGNHLPSGRWRFDEGSGTTAADISGNSRTATLSTTGATWGQGPWYEELIDESDFALALDGTGTAQTVSGSLDTSKPFSVGVWVYVTGAETGRYVAVSQNSVNTSAYQIGFENGSWFFKLAQTDTGTTAWSYVSQSATGMTGQWVHLAGIYDGIELRLYVRAKSASEGTVATLAHESTFTSSGPVRFGAGRSTGQFVGLIDEVVTYPGVLGDDDVLRFQTQPHAQG